MAVSKTALGKTAVARRKAPSRARALSDDLPSLVPCSESQYDLPLVLPQINSEVVVSLSLQLFPVSLHVNW